MKNSTLRFLHSSSHSSSGCMRLGCTWVVPSALPQPSQLHDMCSLQAAHMDRGLNVPPQFLHEPLLYKPEKYLSADIFHLSAECTIMAIAIWAHAYRYRLHMRHGPNQFLPLKNLRSSRMFYLITQFWSHMSSWTTAAAPAIPIFPARSLAHIDSTGNMIGSPL